MGVETTGVDMLGQYINECMAVDPWTTVQIEPGAKRIERRVKCQQSPMALRRVLANVDLRKTRITVVRFGEGNQELLVCLTPMDMVADLTGPAKGK